MRRTYNQKSLYVAPQISIFELKIESSLAAGSVSNGELLFKGTNSVSPEMEDWSDNNSNLNDFSQEKWF